MKLLSDKGKFISIAFFSKIGFIIIPISTSISTWVGVIIYLYLLNKQKFLLLQKKILKNILKIIISSTIMCSILILTLRSFSDFLRYDYIYKSIYLLIIVGFASIIYLLSCYLLGLLKIKNYKTN